jgi:hypothetical protein
MRRALILLAAVIFLPTSGCRRLLSSAIADDDAATPTATAVVATASAIATSTPTASATATATATAAATATAHAPASAAASVKSATKKALPKCAAGQSLFATGEDDPPFCAKSCGTDADCKPAKCDGTFGFMVDDKTGNVFTGVGKSVPLCGSASTTPPKASATAPKASR